jgi:hypothetical protein
MNLSQTLHRLDYIISGATQKKHWRTVTTLSETLHRFYLTKRGSTKKITEKKHYYSTL